MSSGQLPIHGPMTDVEFAERCAQEDAASVEAGLKVRREKWGMTGVILLVDGTQYSPSWRAMDGGHEVYRLTEVDAHAVYEETLDEHLDDLGVYWDDGCAWWTP